MLSEAPRRDKISLMEEAVHHAASGDHPETRLAIVEDMLAVAPIFAIDAALAKLLVRFGECNHSSDSEESEMFRNVCAKVLLRASPEARDNGIKAATGTGRFVVAQLLSTCASVKAIDVALRSAVHFMCTAAYA